MQEFLQRLLIYNDESNRRFIEAVRDTKPFADRIRVIFSHILNAHRIWNTRIRGVSPTGGVWTVHPVEQWTDLNHENLERSIAVVKAEPLERIVEYRDTKGNPYRSSVRDILIHIVNHSSYHRGQLAILLGQEEKIPPVTDYIAYVREVPVKGSPGLGTITASQNKALVRQYYDDLWNKWNLAIADEIIAENIDFRGSLGVTVQGIEGFQRYVNMVRAAFPDFHNTVEDLIAERDEVVARLSYQGTHKGELFGIAPTGKQVSYAGVAVFQIIGGKIAAGWVIGDTLSLLRQLGQQN